jgi:hypothetical protein
MRLAYEEDLKKSAEVTIELYKGRSKWIRFKELISRFFSPVILEVVIQTYRRDSMASSPGSEDNIQRIPSTRMKIPARPFDFPEVSGRVVMPWDGCGSSLWVLACTFPNYLKEG